MLRDVARCVMEELGTLGPDEVATLVAIPSSALGKNNGDGRGPGWVVVRDGSADERCEAFRQSLYEEAESKLKTLVSPAGMSRGSSNWSSGAVRGDSTCWIKPDLCKELGAPATAAFVKGMIKLLKPLKPYLGIDDYSVQLAIYPGDGEGYIRHKDSFSPAGAGGGQTSDRGRRMITCLFYLNKSCSGGNLRVYGEESGTECWRDIEPKFGRMVLFRSDIVEHEVLPCFSERIAFTLWASTNSPLPPIPQSVPIDNGNKPMIKKELRNHVHVTGGKGGNDSIFVGIASYRDTECQYTIKDLYEQAEFPERVFVGVVWQCDRDSDSSCFEVEGDLFRDKDATLGAMGEWWKHHVRHVEMPWQQARGPCIARHICKTLWRGEKYFLQTDSHMRFRGKWDSAMASLLESARSEGTPKPILTTYPLGYTLPNNVPDDACATYLVPKTFDNDGILRQSGRRLRRVASTKDRNSKEERLGVIPSLLWASGFSFSDAFLLQEVPYDPLLEFLFFGEEVSMAARLYTHGYDFFAPTEALVYHLWSREHRPTFQQAKVDDEREAMKARSVRRVKALLGLLPPHDDADDKSVWNGLSFFGLGGTRTLREFEDWVGIDLKSGTVKGGEVHLCKHLSSVEGEGKWEFVDDVEALIAADPEGNKNIAGKVEALNLVMSFISNH